MNAFSGDLIPVVSLTSLTSLRGAPGNAALASSILPFPLGPARCPLKPKKWKCFPPNISGCPRDSGQRVKGGARGRAAQSCGTAAGKRETGTLVGFDDDDDDDDDDDERLGVGNGNEEDVETGTGLRSEGA